jgi:type 2 lantibiotic biosynthesis protein LanM
VDGFGPRELRDLAARALTIDERRVRAGDPPASPAGLEAWCAAAADGDWQLFHRWLAARGLQPETAQLLLQDCALADGEDLPGWMQEFRQALAAMAVPPSREAPFVNSRWPIPFEDLLAGVMEQARHRRDGLAGTACSILTDSALATLDRQLLVRLSELLSPALYHDFCLFRMANDPFGGCLAVPDASSSSSGIYDAFVAESRGGGLSRLFSGRPVLARVFGTAVGQWIEVTAEAISRLARDLDEIRRRFSSDASPLEGPSCTGASYGGSDLHNGGRSVFFFEFRDGLKVVYKPRDVGVDGAWRTLLEWLKQAGAPAAAGYPAVLPRQGYGWCEWIDPAPCRDRDAGAEFYRRSGSLLCLLYVLQATDIHFENVIARGEQPVVVDLETLMHPWFSPIFFPDGASEANLAASDRLAESVVATLYLPKWELAARGRLVGLGALNLPDSYRIPRWRYRNINTDAMSLARQIESSVTASHLPVLDGRPLASHAYGAEIQAGFESMYRFLLENRARILAHDGPLAAFRHQPIRALLRPTQLYFLLLKRSLEYPNLGDGASWSLHFDFLARSYDWDDRDRQWRPVLAAERAALAQLDIPSFTTTTGCRDLYAGGSVVARDFFDRPSFDQVLDRIATLNEREMHRQLDYIAQALESQRQWLNESESPPAPRPGGGNDPAHDLRQCALDIANRLADQAVVRAGEAAWMGAIPVGGDERTQLEVIGQDLYAGNAGVALFFAALWRVTEEIRWREMAYAAMRSIRDCLHHPPRMGRLVRSIGIGGGVGIGSVVYVLTRVAGLLEDSSVLEDAILAAQSIREERIEADRNFDVLSGAAGALLGLLALYRATADPGVLRRARICGRRLLNGRSELPSGERLWLTGSEQPLAGMSHGMSGIACALAGLYRETGDPELPGPLRDAVAYETRVYSADARNWPDFRQHSGGPAPFLCRWCHGAPGIALARLLLEEVIDEESRRAEFEVAVETTRREPLRQVDNLCCGNFGRLEVLFTAGVQGGMPGLAEEARTRAAVLMERAARRGTWGWQSGSDALNPGFFTGLAGIGYTLLRFSHPDRLPCAIVWG